VNRNPGEMPAGCGWLFVALFVLGTLLMIWRGGEVLAALGGSMEAFR